MHIRLHGYVRPKSEYRWDWIRQINAAYESSLNMETSVLYERI